MSKEKTKNKMGKKLEKEKKFVEKELSALIMIFTVLRIRLY